jgi:chemotaxis protein histidine kinase CheA
MTASPPLNGHKRPTMPVLGDWRPATPEPVEEQRTPEPQPAPAETPDLVAQAQAEAIRAKAWADAEAQRIAAEAEARAIETKAAAEAEKLRLANERQRMQLEQKAAEHEARIAEANRKREEAERAAENARRQDEEQQEQAAAAAEEIAAADDKWRSYALNFYRVCAVVALPVQLNAFYDRDALWLMAAPLMLEGGAWVVQKGAASAVANGRPAWHYRLIAWLLAFIAAGINLWHGLNAFDPATALGTAFASIAGPGVWDLHEHGRIRRREGVPTRRERKAAEREAKRIAAERAAEEARRVAEKEAAAKAAEEAAAKLAADREAMFPDVWEHALKLAAALGETTVTDAVWRRAHKDVKGTDPGDSPEAQLLRNAAARRLLDARADVPEKSVWKIQDAQVNPQVPPTGRRGSVTGPPVRGTRRAGDTPKFVDAARKQAAITAKTVAQTSRPNDI